MLRYMYRENEDDFVEHELEREIICEELGLPFFQRCHPNELVTGYSLEEEVILVEESVDLVFDNGQIIKECPSYIEHERKEIDFELELFLKKNSKSVEESIELVFDNDRYATYASRDKNKKIFTHHEEEKINKMLDALISSWAVPSSDSEEKELLISGAGAPPLPKK